MGGLGPVDEGGFDSPGQPSTGAAAVGASQRLTGAGDHVLDLSNTAFGTGIRLGGDTTLVRSAAKLLQTQSRYKTTWAPAQTGSLASYERTIDSRIDYWVTDRPALTNTFQGIGSTIAYGSAGSAIAAQGTVHAFTGDIGIQKSASDSNEFCIYMGTMRHDETANAGRSWFTDWSLHGPIGVQPQLFNGVTMFMANYYNGSPSDPTSPVSGAIWAATKPGSGGGTDASHLAATTYPVDVGIGVAGTSGVPGVEAGVGFTKAIRVGGSPATGWQIQSRFSTGIEVQDWLDYGVRVVGRKAGGTGPAFRSEATAGGAEFADGVSIGAPGSVATMTSGGTGVIQQTGRWDGYGAAANSPIYRGAVTGDGSGRWVVTADGRQEWGPGNAARDTFLSRSGVGVLFAENALKIGGNVGFYNTAPVAKPTVTGSRGGNAALASLLTALAGQGLLTDSST